MNLLELYFMFYSKLGLVIQFDRVDFLVS